MPTSAAEISYFSRSQKARNITEKRRRDKLNMYINQLAALLPSEDLHRMDKSSILKQGVEYLKEYNSKYHLHDVIFLY